MLPPGLTFLDHTADVGIAVEAPSLDALFHRAALGMLALLHGLDDEDGGSDHDHAPRTSETTVELEESGPALLLAAWLREILFLHGTGHRDYVDARFPRMEPTALRARVRTAPAARPVREIKGVTYHDLVAEPSAHGWRGRVIFDV